MRKENVMPIFVARIAFGGVILVGLIALIAFGVHLADDIQEAGYCQCLGNQPFINTKYHDGRCLVNVISYEDIDMVETIFIATEYCK